MSAVFLFGALVILPRICPAQPTPILHGAPQSIDSTRLLTNSINDFTEHTYTMRDLPFGSFADCRVTRTFAAPIKSIKVTILSGTADDIGYVGEIPVTPDSLNTTCRLGHVTNEVDVTRAISVSGNTANFTLRARDTCCCDSGWGEDTQPGRSNARLRWQVELAPPAPISPVSSNSANGHYYVLLSPATWSWSEKVAVTLGGHLATIRNETQQNWVYDSFSHYGGTNRLLWIGFNDVATEGRFVWASGVAVTYTHWALNEPNNALGGEDFAAMYQPGHSRASQWNDWGERVLDGIRPFNGVVEIAPPNGPPGITTQPQNRRVNLFSSVTFSVAARGTPPLRYQWRFNGRDIADATNEKLLLTNLKYEQAGNYSVRVTNVLGSVTSTDAVLIVNHPPAALAESINLDEDTTALISLGASDPDGDALTYSVFAPPSHGVLIGTPPHLTFKPATNYFGPDSFRFRVNDGLINSSAVTVSINVLPVNDLPVAASQSLTVTEDTALAITLTAVDAEGDALTYTIVTQPAHGSLAGTPPNVTYLGATNYFGADSFSFKVNDGQADSQTVTVDITVTPVNDPPVAVATISPLFMLSGNRTNLFVFSTNGISAQVIFGGSSSSDVENDPLQYSWFVEGQPDAFANGMLATNELPAGDYTVVLVVSDGQDTGNIRVGFAVIRPAQAVADLVLLVEESDLGTRNKQPLFATLNAAIASFERDNFTAGLNQLNAFQNKVRAQIGPFDADLAEQLIRAAQQIIDAMNGP